MRKERKDTQIAKSNPDQLPLSLSRLLHAIDEQSWTIHELQLIAEHARDRVRGIAFDLEAAPSRH